jgi:hypothetical protein
MPREQYIITIEVDAPEDADLRKATDLACDRLAEVNSDIKVLDSDIDYAPGSGTGRELN